jgi:hypothetical protein
MQTADSPIVDSPTADSPTAIAARLAAMKIGARQWIGDYICERRSQDEVVVVSPRAIAKVNMKQAVKRLEALSDAETDLDADSDSE